MLEYDGISELWKAAPKRLADARELLQAPTREMKRSDQSIRHLRGAVYLSGYAVECILKVYIIEQTDASCRGSGKRVQTWSDVLSIRQERGQTPDLSGRRSHNLLLLYQATDLSQYVSQGSSIYATWNTCFKSWRVSLRYNPNHMDDPEMALQIVDALEAAYNWVRNRTRHQG